MSNPIKIVGPDGLIDAVGKEEIAELVKSLRSLRSESKKLEQVVSGFTAYTDNMKKLLEVGAKLKEQGNPLSPLTDGAKITALERQVDKLTKAFNENKEAAEGQKKLLDLTKASVNELEAESRSLIRQYKALDPSIEANRTQMAGLVADLNKTRTATDALLAPLKKTRHEVEVVERSYNALTAQNKKLWAEIRKMPDAFDLQTGALNRNNKEAVEYAETIARNTEALKNFDKALGSNFRNVGNYPTLMDRVSAALNGTSGAFDGLGQNATSSLKGFAVQTAAAYLGLQALADAAVQAGKFIFDANVQISDSQADVRKTTGLAADEVERLADRLSRRDSRTSLVEQLEIAKIGGQLGIAKEQIYDFTDAIDVAVVALGDDFQGGAEQVATELGKIEGVFRVAEKTGTDFSTSLINIGSVLNEVGAQGKATAPFLTDVALRVGAVTSNAGIGLPDVIAYAATLEGLGYSAEVSGTALNNLIGKMAANSKSFYKIASFADTNLELQEFVDLINNDANAALQLFLKGLNAGGDTTTEFSSLLADLKIEGANARAVITSLAKNTDEFNRYQEIANKQLATGTSLAAEFAVKNNNLAGSWEKLKNNIFNSATGAGIKEFFKGGIDGVNALIAAFRGVDKSQEQAAKSTFLSARANQELASSSQKLLDEYEALARDGVEPSKEEKKKLDIIVLKLRDSFGESVVSINKETGALALNKEAVKEAIKQKLLLANQTASTLALELNATDDQIKQAKVRKKALEDEAVTRADIAEEARKQVGLGREYSRQRDEEFREMANQTSKTQFKARQEQEKINALEEKRAVTLARLNELGFKASDIQKLFAGESKKAADVAENAARKVGGLTEEEIAALEAANKARYELERSRLERQASIFEELSKDEELSENERNQNLRRAAEVRLRIVGLEKAYLLSNTKLLNDERVRITEEGTDKVRQIERKLYQDLRMQELNTITPQVDLDTLQKGLQTTVDLQKQADAAIVDSMNKTYQANKQNLEKQGTDYQEYVDRIQKEEERRRELIRMGFEFGQTLGDAYFQIETDRLASETESYQNQKQRELDLVGDNAEARAAIEEKYQNIERQQRIKSAKLEREMALFNIGIRAAEGVLSVLSTGGGTYYADLGISAGLLTSFILATAGIQAAAVLAQPLPQFFKGVENFRGGWAEVAERGPELVQEGDRYRIVPKRSIQFLQPGANVYTATETKQMLGESYIDKVGHLRMNEEAMGSAQTRLDQAERAKVQYETHIIRQENAEILFALSKIRRAIEKQPMRVEHLSAGELKEYIIREGRKMEINNAMRRPNGIL